MKEKVEFWFNCMVERLEMNDDGYWVVTKDGRI